MGQSKLIPVFMAQVSFPPAGTWCKEMQEIKTINNSCLFCTANGAGVLSNEHVTPQWLLDHLDLPQDDLLFQGVASSNTEELIETPRIHSTFNFVQGHVCQKCNNGWMSRLEAIAKPLLVPLIDGERKVEDLHPTEASIIGKWAAKTAYMHSLTSPLKQPVDAEHLKALNSDVGGPFSNVAVFGMQSDFKKQSAYFLTRYWPLFGMQKIEIPPDVARASYKIGLQFRHLYLLIAFWPDARLRFVIERGLHFAVFPRLGRAWPRYTADFEMGDGPVDQLAVFCRSLGLWIDQSTS